MISFDDIYFKISKNLLQQDFWELNVEEKRNLIDKELKNYIIFKIKEMKISKYISNNNEMSVKELIQIIADNIPKENHTDTLRHFIHCVLNIAGNLQNWSITWWVEDDESLINKPHVYFDERELWTELKTHNYTDYVKTFNFVYDIFLNKFLIKKDIKTLKLNF